MVAGEKKRTEEKVVFFKVIKIETSYIVEKLQKFISDIMVYDT